MGRMRSGGPQPCADRSEAETEPLGSIDAFAPYVKKTSSIRLRFFDITKAGDGNRTHVSSLEGWCSTIELHPHRSQNAKGTLLYINIRKSMISCHAQNRNRTSDTRIFSPLLYQLSYLGSQMRTPATRSKHFCVTTLVILYEFHPFVKSFCKKN